MVPLPLHRCSAARITPHIHNTWAVLCRTTPPGAAAAAVAGLLVLNQPAGAVVGTECDRCPESIDVQNPWNIRALERPEPTTVEDCLYLAVTRERATVKAWR